MIVLVQNSTSEMRKHLSKYEKNQKRAGLRSGTGRTLSRNLNRQTLVRKYPRNWWRLSTSLKPIFRRLIAHYRQLQRKIAWVKSSGWREVAQLIQLQSSKYRLRLCPSTYAHLREPILLSSPTPNDKKIESEEDDPKSESPDEKLKSEKLKKKVKTIKFCRIKSY